MCTHPIELTRKHPGVGNSHYTVPCGQCAECRAFQRDQYACLCTLAAQQFGSMHFFTLTYDNQHVPVSLDGELSLRRADVQMILKRFRSDMTRKLGKPVKFKFSFFGEYGDKTHRPHYHLMTFGLSDSQAEMLASHWRRSFGFVHLDSIPFLNPDGSPAFVKVALYVSKYTAKQDVLPEWLRNSMAEKPRRQSSVGLGLDFEESELQRMRSFTSPRAFICSLSGISAFSCAPSPSMSSAKNSLSLCQLNV